MGCTPAPTVETAGETITGFLPGMNGCGCGCAGEVSEAVIGRMVGVSHNGFVVRPETGFTWGRSPGASSSRVATEAGPQTSAQKEASEDAYRTNAVISSGDLDLLEEWLEVRGSGDEVQVDNWWFEHNDELGLLYLENWLPEPSSCGDAMLGDWRECYVPDPYTQPPRTTDDLNAMDLEAHADSIEIDGASDEERTLLLAAWEFLHQNLDLVEWSLCIVLGADSRRAKRLIRKMTRSAVTVTMQVTDDCDPWTGAPFTWYGYAGISGGKISICGTPSDRFVRSYLRVWLSAATVEAKWCAAIDLAATLLHELTHTVGLAADDKSNRCDVSYLIENAFRFIVFRRYPEITDAPCCAKWATGLADDLFGDSKSRSFASGDC